jgi:hypothetical protein
VRKPPEAEGDGDVPRAGIGGGGRETARLGVLGSAGQQATRERCVGFEDDADYIIKRAEEKARALVSRAEDAEAIKDFGIAIACWEELGKYKGVEDASEATARLKKLRDSADVKKEMTARRDLIALQYELAMDWAKVEKKDDDTDPAVKKFREASRDSYKKFAEKHAGTAAAAVAGERAVALEDLLKGKESE